MKYALFIFYLALIFISPARAQDTSPLGEWQVADGDAHVRVMDCAGKLWGVISWTREPGTDDNNPDPAKRGRPILGMPIILGMQANKNAWEGEIYNSENGKTYHGGISLNGANSLHIKGCLLGGFLCGGEDWVRITPSRARFSCPS